MLRVKRRARGSNGQENRKRVKEVSSIFNDCEDTAEGMKQKACWKEPSQELATKFFASIVSLASFDGAKLHYKSTGIIVENCFGNTSILTTSALVSTSDPEHRFNYGLKIKVRLPNKQLVDGWIQHDDLPFSMALVITRYSPDLRTVCFSNSVLVERHTDLLALKCCFESGKLMQTHGVSSDDPSKIDSKGSMLSTCKITMDGSGGLLVDLDGNIVGMNDYHDQEGTPYVQGNEIDNCLKVLRRRWEDMRRHCLQNFSSGFRRHLEGSSNQNGYTGGSESKNPEPQALEFAKAVRTRRLIDDEHKVTLNRWPTDGSSNQNGYTGESESKNPEPQALEFTKAVRTPRLIDEEHKVTLNPWPTDGFAEKINNLLNKDGYPLPVYADGGMRLEGNFEEEFGRDILSEPARKIALKMSRSVVALASFSIKDKVKKRHFACTGVCIDFNGSTFPTRVLTSASLVRTSGDENKIVDGLEISVCLPSQEYFKGELENCDFHYNVAVISFPFRCNRPAMLVDAPQTEVLALGRAFKSGNSMATEGSVTDKECNFGCKEELKISTCKITKAGIGGPLLDFKGNVIGMNFYGTEGTPYLPSEIILKVLSSFGIERPIAAGITNKPNNRPKKKKANTRRQNKKPNTRPKKKKPNTSNDSCPVWPVQEPYWYYPSKRPEIEPKSKVIYQLL